MAVYGHKATLTAFPRCCFCTRSAHLWNRKNFDKNVQTIHGAVILSLMIIRHAMLQQQQDEDAPPPAPVSGTLLAISTKEIPTSKPRGWACYCCNKSGLTSEYERDEWESLSDASGCCCCCRPSNPCCPRSCCCCDAGRRFVCAWLLSTHPFTRSKSAQSPRHSNILSRDMVGNACSLFLCCCSGESAVEPGSASCPSCTFNRPRQILFLPPQRDGSISRAWFRVTESAR